jgi:hypothetical protein
MEKPHERARAVVRAVVRKVMLRAVPFDDRQWWVKIEIS